MADYQLVLVDPAGVILDYIDGWIALSYTRATNDIGELNLTLPGDYPIDFLKVDGRLAVQRNGKIDTGTVFLIRKIERSLVGGGERLITVSALSATYILDSRIVAYKAETPQAEKIGKADNVMKSVVRQNLGTNATPTFRDISAWLSVEPNAGLGPTVQKAFAHDNVLDVLKEMTQMTVEAGSPVYFDIVAPTLSTLEFRTYRGLRGIDHGSDSNDPVVLSPERGNLEVPVSRVYDWSDEITYVYAGGQGAGSAQDIRTASSAERIGRSPFGLREQYLNVSMASGSNASNVLLDEADAALREGRPFRVFSGRISDIPGSRYGIHWGFGDRVVAEFEGESVNCVVDGISVSVQAGTETISGTLRAEED